MRPEKRAKLFQITMTIVSAALALGLVVMFLGGQHVQAASQKRPGVGSNPAIRYITLSSSLPMYDPAGGDGISKTVYFSNSVNGIITMTFEISGTPTLTLTAGAAFNESGKRLYASEEVTPTFVVTYSVARTHRTQPNIIYTAVNTSGVQTTVAVTYVRDVTAPTSVITPPLPGTWSGLARIPISWAADDTESGVKQTRLYYALTSTNVWTKTLTEDGTTGTFYFTPTEYDTYYFSTQAVDHLGAAEVYSTGLKVRPVLIKPAHVYLPVIQRNYKPFVNGDFEQEWLGWTRGQGPFNGHGTGLPTSIALFEGSNRALLGSPALDGRNGSIPVGYAYIAQEFTVPSGAPILTMTYRVHTFDTVLGPSTNDYFDTFEVSINKAPPMVTDGERDSTTAGCQGSALNPDNVTRVPAGDGLVICGGAPSRGTNELWDSGWRTVRLNLTAFAGANITLYFANWSREYKSQFYDDHGYFNTYTYVDNILIGH